MKRAVPVALIVAAAILLLGRVTRSFEPGHSAAVLAATGTSAIPGRASTTIRMRSGELPKKIGYGSSL